MKTGVLCIHGFTGGPFEVQPFADYIEEQTNWVVKVPALPGHGETLFLKNSTAEQWMMEAELALRELKKETDRIIIVGFSMGGLIAMHLATRYKVDRLVLLSAAAKYFSPAQFLKAAAKSLNSAVRGGLSEDRFFQMYKYKWTHTPIRATVQFLRVAEMVKPYYSRIRIPVCIVQGKKDGIVPASAADFIYDHIGSEEKQLIHSETGQHLICYSDDCDDWFRQALDFMKKLEE
ncbi:carboxylesterase [Planomicrobium sp. CPCC 101110]|uniref:alpha/beta hydrolase n=1 Tax=Planomicrobium sp. CPCC 101110 TaxID=2599619 RepID=UPI0011B3EDAB|nr:alpha/beta fold hydrolase [Planomicrobium sp. CPCC 101110]TWT24618.1 alpha/beta fold hydrolase [Planomicrobium sp. CPCC 101110]